MKNFFLSTQQYLENKSRWKQYSQDRVSGQPFVHLLNMLMNNKDPYKAFAPIARESRIPMGWSKHYALYRSAERLLEKLQDLTRDGTFPTEHPASRMMSVCAIDCDTIVFHTTPAMTLELLRQCKAIMTQTR